MQWCTKQKVEITNAKASTPARPTGGFKSHASQHADQSRKLSGLKELAFSTQEKIELIPIIIGINAFKK